MKKLYQIKGVDCVLVDADDEKFKDVECLDYAGNVKAIAVTDLPEDSTEGDAVLSHEDLMCGEYYGGEIVSTSIVNPENEQKLIEAFVSPEYAEKDEGRRQLCVMTDSYYDWKSERKAIHDSIYRCIRAAIENDAYNTDTKEKIKGVWNREWEGIVSAYNTSDMSPEEYGFGCVWQEAERAANF